MLLLTAFTQIYKLNSRKNRKKYEKHSLARRLNVVIVTDRMGTGPDKAQVIIKGSSATKKNLTLRP